MAVEMAVVHLCNLAKIPEERTGANLHFPQPAPLSFHR